MPFLWDRSSPVLANDWVFYTESEIQLAVDSQYSKKVLWVVESPIMVSQMVVDLVLRHYKDFFAILTHDDRLLHLKNAFYFPIGGCWIKQSQARVYHKTKTVSTVASNKNWTKGQQMRHQVAKIPNIDVFGPSYLHLQHKIDALMDYQYHVCFENDKNQGYFTEKIIDCFATGTIPIYWGANNISSIFNTNGVIEVDSVDEATYVLNNLHLFNIDRNAVTENFEISREYWIPETRIFKLFADS